jgi:RNA polymerase sigma-B factor
VLRVYVQLLSRTLGGTDSFPALAVERLARALRQAGATVMQDCAVAAPEDAGAAARLAGDLAQSWSKRLPDVVHAHGSIACHAALTASRGRVPVVVTMDESSGTHELETELVRRADRLLVRSGSERDGWVALDVPADRVHLVPLPVGTLEKVPGGALEPRVVVTDARGQMLERILLSMRSWPADVGLAVIDPAAAEDRGLALRARDRVEVVPADAALWERACVVLAGPSGARHAGLVVEAARHGVPAVATDIGANCEVVVDGATGVLLPVTAGPRAIGNAVAELIGDPLRLRGYGLAAHLRVRATHDPALVAERCLAAYAAAIEARRNPPTPDVADRRVAEQADATAASDASTTGSGGSDAEDPWHELVLEHLPVARRLAQRYAGRGQSVDDLVQVANLGLVKAAQRFEPDQGTPFVAYAVPTMLGELRRYFRDNAWAIHVPRSVQETALRVRHAGDRLRQTLGHEVDVSEIAHDLGLAVDDVLEARNASGVAFACRSLDAALLDDGDSRLSEILGSDDASLEQIEARESLRVAFARLPAREREILVLRFFGELTQAEIAERLGISQMHVSRLLARTLRTLRDYVLDDAPLPAGWGATTPS